MLMSQPSGSELTASASFASCSASDGSAWRIRKCTGRAYAWLMLARHREALVAAAAAGSVAALLAWLGPPGTDFAAHAYERALFLRHGFVLWDNYWYTGRYSFVGYSLVYYPLAAVLGIRLLATLAAAVAAFAFAELVGSRWGAAARWASLSFAVLWAGFVLTGAFPFALGVTFALLALRALQAGRRWI